MALILKCDKCNKDMGALEKFVIKDDKYLCVKCGETTVSTALTIPDDWEGVGFLGLMISNTAHKKTEYIYFHNCNFTFVGTTTYTNFKNSIILPDPNATKDQVVDVFQHDPHFILVEENSWSIYYGHAPSALSIIYNFDRDTIENALSALPSPAPLMGNFMGVSFPLVP